MIRGSRGGVRRGAPLLRPRPSLLCGRRPCRAGAALPPRRRGAGVSAAPRARRHAGSQPDRDRLRARRGRPAGRRVRVLGLSRGRSRDPSRRRPRGRSPRKSRRCAPISCSPVAEGNGRGAVGALEAAGVPVLTVVPRARSTPCSKRIRHRRADGSAGRRGTAARRGALRPAARPSRRRRRRPGPSARRSCSSGRTRRRRPEEERSSTTSSREAGARQLGRQTAGAGPCSRRSTSRPRPSTCSSLPESAETRPAYETARRSGTLSRGTAARARVVGVDEAVLTRPGPRVFDALEALAKSLHPSAAGAP